MQAAQAAGMFAVVAGYGIRLDDDRADNCFHMLVDTPLSAVGLDKPRIGKA